MARKIDFVLKFSIYLITNRHLLPPKRDLVETVEEALRGGVGAVQLREKDLSSKELYRLALELCDITHKYNAIFIVNDRLDIAMAVGADGVHLTTQSLPIRIVRRIAGENVIIGVSTHSLDEIENAKIQGADYVTFSPIYFTPSKAKYGPPQGIEALSEACKVSGDLSVIALGGITKDRVKEVVKTGASGIAVVSAIMAAEDPYKASKELVMRGSSIFK